MPRLMFTRSLFPLYVFAALAAACGSSSEPPATTETLRHAIVAGNNQKQAAGTMVNGKRQLTDAVVQQIVKDTKTGQLRMYRVLPRRGLDRLLDVVVPRAWAQGQVLNGAPVVGAVVCVPADSPLKPFVQCTNTDAQGKATFFFEPPNTAGVAKAEIRGVVNELPAVFDTATATVLPGPPDPDYEAIPLAPKPSPAVLTASAAHDTYFNPIPFRIPADGRLVPADTTLGSAGARTVFFDEKVADGVYRELTLTGNKDSLMAKLRYRIVLANAVPTIEWSIYGLNVKP
jgi:hypothetical protein